MKSILKSVLNLGLIWEALILGSNPFDSRKAFYKMPHNKKWKSIDRKLENSKIQSKKLEEEKQ